jgi:hypothetical protein
MNVVRDAYAAGIFDIKGNVSITRKRVSSNNPTKTVQVKVYSIFPTITLWFKHNYGGCAGNNSKVPMHGYEWSVKDAKAIQFLKCIYPYLINKKNQVEIVMEFRDATRESDFHGYTIIEEELRDSLLESLRILKLREREENKKQRLNIVVE